PATLQALLAARLDALERAQKLVLQHAALLGEASAEELAALGERDVAGALGSLVDAGLLRRTAGERYEPADPLLGEVAYDMLPRTARGELHRRAAAAVRRPEDRVRHLERAAQYEPDDPALAAAAAAALAEQAMSLLRSSRNTDAMVTLEKAVALGLRRPASLVELARLQGACNKEDEALATLALIPDDPADPAQAAERDHTAATVDMFRDPIGALPRFYDAAERWHELGNTSKEAWAYANAGVAHFNVSQMEESARALDQGLSLFQQLGDNAGAVAASSFLCLVRPGDPRVDTWLDDALRFASETGDRNRQMTTLLTLTWKHFFQCFGGTAADTAQAEGFATQLAGLAMELGAPDLAVHGLSLLALMARLTGRLDEAVAHVATLQRTVARANLPDPWLAWATSFSVAVAGGEREAAPPYPPEDSLDPVISMAGLVIDIEMLLAGRVDEVLARRALTGPSIVEGPMADVGGLVFALALLLGGHSGDAQEWITRGAEAARVLHGRPGAAVAAALAYEAGMGGTEPPPMPPTVSGMAELLAVRARARAGDAEAAEVLRGAAKALAAPGLAVGFA
ncbi:MAG TPA: hypothetical protein VE991_03530, partial [Acidimicrobiales bacterium]|nr:hypothetical protein [Acidimicrobiales bacterium]